MKKILIVEDEEAINTLIKLNLEGIGYSCIQVFDGEEAASIVEQEPVDLAIVDIMLPTIDGYELCSFLNHYNIPVIFLTAKIKTEDIVKGLSLGADDYLTKPFEIIELLARVGAVMRRVYGKENLLNFQNVTLQLDNYQVSKNGQIIELTLKEFQLLELLIRNRGLALSRDYIYEKVWGKYELEETRTVDLHIQRLRSKTGLATNIVTVYKIGYRLETS